MGQLIASPSGICTDKFTSVHPATCVHQPINPNHTVSSVPRQCAHFARALTNAKSSPPSTKSSVSTCSRSTARHIPMSVSRFSVTIAKCSPVAIVPFQFIEVAAAISLPMSRPSSGVSSPRRLTSRNRK